MTTSRTLWHWLKPLNRRLAKNYQRGIGPPRLVLLLTTIGRKSGQPRMTPLQYEEHEGVAYVASARGQEADWFRNILADPNVRVHMKDREFDAVAEPITDPIRVADFLELRLRRHPIMLRLIMCLFEGLPWRFTRADLERFASQKALVALHPVGDGAFPLHDGETSQDTRGRAEAKAQPAPHAIGGG